MIRSAALLPLAVLACAAPAARNGGPGPVPRAGLDTLTIASLPDELSPPPDLHTWQGMRTREFVVGPVTHVVDLAPFDSSAQPYLQIEVLRPGSDPRDLLDRPGAVPAPDVVVTRHPAAIAYARAQEGFTVQPLAWDRVYALLVSDPSRSRSLTDPRLRARITPDAVRVEARPAAAHYDWMTAMACPTALPRAGLPGRRVVYLATDPAARDLAERIVALDGTLRAAPLPADSVAASLARGADEAYVIPLPTGPVEDGCELPPRVTGSLALPLLETRAHAIVRAGTPPVVIAPGEAIRWAPDSVPAR